MNKRLWDKFLKECETSATNFICHSDDKTKQHNPRKVL